MKNILILLSLLVSSFAFAAKPYGTAGCGLGSIVMGSDGNQILAATTNKTGSQTFGVSSGTSNCTPDVSNTAAVRKNVEIFVAANKTALANDIAKSNGETIVTLGNIMGCKDNHYLATKLQSRYETIFKAKEEKALTDNVYNTVVNDRYLVENCKL